MRRGARLFVVDPRRTETAQWADLWLGPDVGSDIALANTMARHILHRGLQHRSFIERATAGFDAFAASVQDWTLERGEAVTGVPGWAIAELAFTSGVDAAVVEPTELTVDAAFDEFAAGDILSMNKIVEGTGLACPALTVIVTWRSLGD